METDVKTHGTCLLGCGFRAESNPQGQNKAAAGLSTAAVFIYVCSYYFLKSHSYYIIYVKHKYLTRHINIADSYIIC